MFKRFHNNNNNSSYIFLNIVPDYIQQLRVASLHTKKLGHIRRHG